MSPQKSFQIGQIVYILSDEAEAIIPAIVVEEQIIKKLDGEKVSWKIAIGPKHKRKEMASNNIKGELYTSLDEIKTIMTNRLIKFVDGLVATAEKRTESWYDTNFPNKETPSSSNKIDPVQLTKEFDNNNEPTPLPAKTPTTTVKEQTAVKSSKFSSLGKDEFRKQLLNASIGDNNDNEEENKTIINDYIIADDGRKIPIKYNLKE